MNYRPHEIVALRDVWFSRLRKEGGSPDYDLRRIFREYSKLFHTPLHVVHELPVDFVVRAWLEEIYEKYENEDLRQEALDLLRTEEDLIAAKLREDEDDAYAFNALREESKAAVAIQKLEEAMKAVRKIPLFGSRNGEPELTNVKGPKIQEGITMVFGPAEGEEDEDSFGILEKPKGKAK